MLPDVARRKPRLMPSTHGSAHGSVSVSMPTITVERRPLAAYTRLAQLSELPPLVEQLVALSEEVA